MLFNIILFATPVLLIVLILIQLKTGTEIEGLRRSLDEEIKRRRKP